MGDFFKRVGERLWAIPLVRQFAGHTVVGLLSLVVEYSVLIALVELAGVWYLAATTVAYATSVAFNYALSTKYVFQHREGMGRGGEFTVYMGLAAIALGLNDLLMYIGVDVLGIQYLVAKLIVTFMVTWYNFFSRRIFLTGGGKRG